MPKIDVLQTPAAAVEALKAAAADGASAPPLALALAAPDGGLDSGLAWVVDAAAGRVAFVGGPLLSDAAVSAALADLLTAPAEGTRPDPSGSQTAPADGTRPDPSRSQTAPAEGTRPDPSGSQTAPADGTRPGPSGSQTAPAGDTDPDSGRPLAVHGAKALMRPLLDRGIEMRDPLLDTMLAAYLLDPADARYDLNDLAGRYAGIDPPAHAPQEGRLDLDGDSIEPHDQAGWAALAIDRLGHAPAGGPGRPRLGEPQRRRGGAAGAGAGPHGAHRDRRGPLGPGTDPRRARHRSRRTARARC